VSTNDHAQPRAFEYSAMPECTSTAELLQRSAVLRAWVDNKQTLAYWTHKYLASSFGDSLAPLAIGPRLRSTWMRLPLAEAIKSFSTPDGVQRYVRQMPIPPQLIEAVAELRLFELYPADRAIITNLWIGPKGTLQPFHKDNHNSYATLHGIILQLYGEKEVMTVDPVYDHCMYKITDKLHSHYSEIDLNEFTRGKYPLFADAKVCGSVLQAGDVLHISPNTWHRVESLSESVSISCWWHSTKVADRIYRSAMSDRKISAANLITIDDLRDFGNITALLHAIRSMGVAAVSMFMGTCDHRARAFLLAQAELFPPKD
jgi:hypothetical protein